MNCLQTKKDQLTGIKEIDTQYRKLIARINAVLFPEDGRISNGYAFSTLEFLFQYVERQFSAEERAMEYYGYDNLDSHRKQHEEMREKVGQLYRRASLDGNDGRLADELYNLLYYWLTIHIKEWDQHYTLYVQKCLRNEFNNLGLDDVDPSLLSSIDFEDKMLSPA